MLLLTDLTSAPDDKSIGTEYCQKKTRENVSPYLYQYCICKVCPILVPIPKMYCSYYW